MYVGGGTPVADIRDSLQPELKVQSVEQHLQQPVANRLLVPLQPSPYMWLQPLR